MKRDLTDEEMNAVERLIRALSGLTYEQAELILKETITELKARAIIKGDDY